jgi:hypothetical protein
MQHRKLVAVALVLLGLAVAVFGGALIHSHDGSVLETHCNACLLQLGTRGVVTEPFTLLRTVAVVGRIAPAPPPSLEDAAPRTASSRGPPSA